jgi:hypothetical protein
MPERAPVGNASIESRSSFTVPILTEENQKKCPRLKEVDYCHPLYGFLPLPKLVLCSISHDHQLEAFFEWNQLKGKWDKSIVQVYAYYENLIPTEDKFEESMLLELERFESMGRVAKERGVDLREFLEEMRRKHPPRKPEPPGRMTKLAAVPPKSWKSRITPHGEDEKDVRAAVSEALEVDTPTGENRPVPKCEECDGPHATNACDTLPEAEECLLPDF